VPSLDIWLIELRKGSGNKETDLRGKTTEQAMLTVRIKHEKLLERGWEAMKSHPAVVKIALDPALEGDRDKVVQAYLTYYGTQDKEYWNDLMRRVPKMRTEPKPLRTKGNEVPNELTNWIASYHLYPNQSGTKIPTYTTFVPRKLRGAAKRKTMEEENETSEDDKDAKRAKR
jgi:hypothetical protein